MQILRGEKRAMVYVGSQRPTGSYRTAGDALWPSRPCPAAGAQGRAQLSVHRFRQDERGTAGASLFSHEWRKQAKVPCVVLCFGCVVSLCCALCGAGVGHSVPCAPRTCWARGVIRVLAAGPTIAASSESQGRGQCSHDVTAPSASLRRRCGGKTQFLGVEP